MLELGQGYWQLSVKEERRIRNKSNSLSSLISEAVYLQAFLQLSFSFSTDLQGREEICSVVSQKRVLKSLELPRSGNGTHAFSQGNFFLIRSAATQEKGPSTGPEASLVMRK